MFLLPTLSLGYFLAIISNPEAFSNGAIVFDDSKNSMIPRPLMVLKSRQMKLWTLEFDGSQVFLEPKGISIRSVNFDNPKVYSDTPTFNALVLDS